MKIELITIWYNEEFLAPFFLNHYSWVDKIHILLDADTNDATEKITADYPNVSIEYFKFPDMMDDIIKARKINEKYRTIIDADYVIVVDSDEFIFCNMLDDSARKHIIEKNKSLYFATLWQIYQHESDSRLDPTKPLLRQRRNGDPAIANCYIKPVVARTGIDILWGYGNHSVVLDSKFMSWNTPNVDVMNEYYASVKPADMLQGAHWKLFDLDETIRRRIQNRTNRQSQFNIKVGLTHHHHKTCIDDIITEYNNMKCSPVVIKDRICSGDDTVNHESIFENVLAENSFSENHLENKYAEGITSLLVSCDLPDWYTDVQPQTPSENVADDMFLLATEYYKNGNYDKAIKILQKAVLLAPDSIHYPLYLKIWQNRHVATQKQPLC